VARRRHVVAVVVALPRLRPLLLLRLPLPRRQRLRLLLRRLLLLLKRLPLKKQRLNKIPRIRQSSISKPASLRPMRAFFRVSPIDISGFSLCR
jgi:hypothetical protein